MAVADVDLAAVGLDDAPKVRYVSPPGPALLSGPPTVQGELSALETLPTVRSRWLDKLIFLGTGTSGQVPAIQCLTHASASESGVRREYQPCAACHDVLLHGPLSRNRRTCTAAVVVGGPKHAEARAGAADGDGTGRREDQTTLLIDCGPTFYQEACKAWATHDLRRIDAVLLTHGHADAVLGLDHLRAWTIGRAVQTHVDVYLSPTTYDVVSQMFPYLADPRKATGGGGVGQLRWHIIDPQQPSFTISPPGKSPVDVVPLPVAHGLAPDGGSFEFVGWRIGEMSYVSDCSEVPPSTVARMQGSEVVVLDALKWNRHLSHYSIDQALQLALQLANPPLSSSSESLDTDRDQAQARLDGPSAAAAASVPHAPDASNPLKLVLLTDLTHFIEHWMLARQLSEWEGDMHLIAQVANARVKRAAHEHGLGAAAALRDAMVRACPDVHALGAAPPKARGPYASLVRAPAPASPQATAVQEAATGCWWHPYWKENRSEEISRLETELACPAVRAQVQRLLEHVPQGPGAGAAADGEGDSDGIGARKGEEATAAAFHVPAFRVAYDQLAVVFK